MIDPTDASVAHTTWAIAALAPGDVEAADSFREVQIALGPLGPHDLLVEVRAVSVNPLDIKLRSAFDEQEAPKVLDHHQLREQVRAVAPDGVNHIFSAFSPGNEATYADLMVVYGEVVAIDGPLGIDISALKKKSQAWRWEWMITSSVSALIGGVFAV